MPNVRALILAAGRGSRLGSSADETPKSLLQIGGRHLIEHQLEVLAEAGVGPVHIVVGYGSDEVREVVGRRAEFIVNPRWSTTNSLYSFWLARDSIKGDVIVLNCDVLLSQDVVARLLDKGGDAIAIDSGSGSGREQMKVRIVEGRVVEMSKTLPPEDVSGENVGILKLTEASAQALFEKSGVLVAAGGEKEWLGAAVARMARERNFQAVDVAGIPWIEIDFPVDLNRARKEIWPAIQGGAYKRRRLWRAATWVLGIALLTGAIVVGSQWSAPAPAPPAQDWEGIPIENLAATKINLGDRQQAWWLLDEGQVAEIQVAGPSTIRVETRLLDRPGEREPYAIELVLDGELLEWHVEMTRPSKKATHKRWTVSHRKRVTIDLPEGVHALHVRLVAPAGARCLIRARQLADAVED